MPHDSPHSAALEEAAIEDGHQSDGVRESVTAIVAVAMALSVPLIMIILWLQFKSTESARYRGLASPTLAGPQSQPSKAMPEPQLEIIPGSNLAALRARDETELDTYGWINRSNNTIRIPIERAMELIVQRGLPASGAGHSEYELILERSRDRKAAPSKEVR